MSLTERDRLAMRQRNEAIAADEARIERERKSAEELRAIQEEIRQNTIKLAEERKKRVLGYQEQHYVPDDMKNVTMTWDDAAKFTSAEAAAFAEECEDWWYPSPENKATLIEYFERRDAYVVDRRMWKAAAISLLRDGLLEPKPVPAPAVAPVAPVQRQEDVDPPRVPDYLPRPIAHFEPEQGAMGWDENNNEVWYSAASISRMSSSQYKSAFHVRPPLLAA